MCILFPWFFPKHGGGFSEKWELHCLYVYIIPLITYFPKYGGGCSHKWELQCLNVYTIPVVTYFPKFGGGCSQKWELQCMYMYNIPLITYFPNTEELLTAIRIAMYMCILFLWSHISPTWKRLLKEMTIARSVCVYYSLDHLFPQHGGVARSNENCNVCMYIIPLIPYLPDREGVAERN